MGIFKVAVILVSLLLITSTAVEAKRKKHKSSDISPSKTKTKTKWSTSTDLGPQSQNSMIATEEHGYYVKRTFLPIKGNQNSSTPTSPPFLAVPIAWFPCQGTDECMKLNSMAINSNQNSLSQGFVCDDDCIDAYEPICGKTSNEVAVFYNKCKLNVAKCRSHGLWRDFAYEECKMQYSEEVKYADMKFRSNPYFKEKLEKIQEKPKEESMVLIDLNINNKQLEEDDVSTKIPLEIAPEAVVLIKEVEELVPIEKVKESKDHYVELKIDSKESSEEQSM